MAGSIGLSLSQRLDKDSLLPLSGGLLYFYEAGTTDPQNAYQDEALTIAWPNPLTLDAGGNIPQLFFADGQIKIRLTNKLGIVQLAVDNILVIGPSSGGGGGGGGGVDATTVLATGDIKTRYGNGSLTGFVRLNGRTIGSATSGASEMANSAAQALFEYLWSADANLTVSTGRGVSGNADWTANKQLTLPDARGRVLASLDDMGNTAAGRLTSTYFGSDATVLGAANGAESQTLTQAQLPAVKPTGTLTIGAVTVALPNGYAVSNGGNGDIAPGGGGDVLKGRTVNPTFNVSQAASSYVTDNLGSGNAHPNVQPTLLVTNYIKL